MKDRLFFEMSMSGEQVRAIYSRLKPHKVGFENESEFFSASGVIRFKIWRANPGTRYNDRFQVQHYVAPENVHLLPQEPICMPSGIWGGSGA